LGTDCVINVFKQQNLLATTVESIFPPHLG